MSLRIFHILFISLATIGAFGGATLLWNSAGVIENAPVWAGGSFLAGIALLVYGGWFLGKIQKLEAAEKSGGEKK